MATMSYVFANLKNEIRNHKYNSFDHILTLLIYQVRVPEGRPSKSRAFNESRRYHTRIIRLNWGPKNVHSWNTHFRDSNDDARILIFFWKPSSLLAWWHWTSVSFFIVLQYMAFSSWAANLKFNLANYDLPRMINGWLCLKIEDLAFGIKDWQIKFSIVLTKKTVIKTNLFFINLNLYILSHLNLTLLLL